MENIDVLYIYEHVARELDVACAVKCIAEQQFGTRIELSHWPSGLPRAFHLFRPRVVVFPHYFSARNFSSVLLEWRKSIFFNLCWEQLLSETTRKSRGPHDEFARRIVMHHSWSSLFTGFQQKYGIPAENIFTNGQPAYMLYQEPYCRHFEGRVALANQYNLDVNRRWILFPENSWRGLCSDDEVEEWVRGDGISRAEAYTMRDFARSTLEVVVEWCATLARHNAVEVIIRPRPATPLNDFKATVQQRIEVIPEGMHFIKEESVGAWIRASDVVISSLSSTLIEAALAGRSAYMLEPRPIPRHLHVDWHDYIPRLGTQVEFEKACLNGPLSTQENRLANWARTVLLGRGDAIWNLADFLARLCRSEIPHPAFPSRKIVTRPGRLPLPKWALYEYRRIRYRKTRRNMVHEVHPTHENDHLSKNEIEQRINMWKRVLTDQDYTNHKRMGLNKIYVDKPTIG